MHDLEADARGKVEALGSDIDLATFAASFNLFRISTRVIHDLESSVHRPRGLSIAGFRILFTIWTLGDLEPRQLATLAGVSRAAISGAVSTLAGAGLVTKVKEKSDRRLITVRLTDAGAEVLESAYRAQNKREQLLFDGVSSDDLQAFTRVSRQLATNAGKLEKRRDLEQQQTS